MEQFIEYLESFRILDIKLIDIEDFLALMLRFSLNILVVYIIVNKIYFPLRKSKEYFFSYFMLNTLVFFVCYLMSSVELGLGFGFGLFGLFAIMRYRTTTVPVREMTYLFSIVAIAVVNAISTKKISYSEIIFTNSAILGMIFILEKVWYKDQQVSKTLTYEKIENIKPQNREAMLADLKDRTGLDITHFVVLNIDFMTDTAKVKIYFKPIELEEYF